MTNPTSNLVTRLRAFPGGVGAEALCREAASEIERLQGENRTLREYAEYPHSQEATSWRGPAAETPKDDPAVLREYLRVYGGHIPPCVGRPCECGFQKAWEVADLSGASSAQETTAPPENSAKIRHFPTPDGRYVGTVCVSGDHVEIVYRLPTGEQS